MSMVWPCPLTVDVYASMGRAVRVPGPECRRAWCWWCLVWLLAACPPAGAGAHVATGLTGILVTGGPVRRIGNPGLVSR